MQIGAGNILQPGKHRGQIDAPRAVGQYQQTHIKT